eukprot:1726484-Alexandrium_andersonii.AAC.1
MLAAATDFSWRDLQAGKAKLQEPATEEPALPVKAKGLEEPDLGSLGDERDAQEVAPGALLNPG